MDSVQRHQLEWREVGKEERICREFVASTRRPKEENSREVAPAV